MRSGNWMKLDMIAWAAVFTLLAVTSLNAADVVHRYDFEDEDGSDSIGDLDGLTEGVPLFSDDAMSGNVSIILEGDQYVVFDEPMDFGTQFSVALWVLPDSTALGIQNLIGNAPGGWDTDGWKLYYNTWSDPATADGALILETGDGQDFGLAGEAVRSDVGVISEDQWYHIVNTIDVDTGDVAFYLDGEPLATTGALNVDMKTDSPFEIGRMLGNWDLHGQMDDIQIYEGLITEDGAAWLSDNPGSVLGDNAPTALEAGDADMNYEFNQLDLVKVQIAAKYLTGQSATWGEGDWNGAPGGSVGNPPAGDNLFTQTDIIAALAADKYLTGPYNAIPPNGQEGDGQASIVYNAGTGELGVDAPAGTNLTSVNIDSASGIFAMHGNAENLDGSFDNHSENNIFKATFGSSFGSLSFGVVAQAGLAEDVVAADLTVVGSLEGGGGLGDVDLVYIPEPAAVTLLCVGLVGMLLARRRR